MTQATLELLDRQGPSTRGAFSCLRSGVGAPASPAEGGAGGRTLPPAYWPHGSPRGSRCRQGRDARRSSANVRLPAAAQVDAVKPFVLDGLPGTTLAGYWRWSVVGRAFGACCSAGKLRSPASPTGKPRLPGSLVAADPYGIPYVNPYGIPCATGGVPDPSSLTCICPAQDPSGGQSAAKTAADWPPSGEWSGRAARSASRD